MLDGSIAGSFGGGRLGAAGFRRFGRTGALVPAMVAAFAIASFSLFGMASSVSLFTTLLGLQIFTGAIVATLGVAAIKLIIPNEIRRLMLGLNAFVTAVFAAAFAPLPIALLSELMGCETQFGFAVAILCIPSGLLSAGNLAWATRSAHARE